MSREWEDIRKEFEQMCGMSMKTKDTKVNIGYIFDEDKSVKWNREQVKNHNEKVDMQRKELVIKRRDWEERLLSEIYDKIIDDVEMVSNKEQAQKVWTYVYENSHSHGVYDMFWCLQTTIDFLNDLGGSKSEQS